MIVYVSGEDHVTKLIAKKLVLYCCPENLLDALDMLEISPRERGTKALENIPKMIELGKSKLVVGVFDSDDTCIVDPVPDSVEFRNRRIAPESSEKLEITR